MGPQLGRAAESASGVLEEWTVCPPLSCLWRWLGCTCCDGCRVLTPDCCFGNPFLGAVHGGTGRSGMLGACVVRPWSHVVAPVFRELLCLGGCVPRLLPHVFDSAGSARVVFGLTRVVVEAFLSFHCIVALCGRDSLSEEFVARWSWWRFVAPCVSSNVSGESERL
ncbi:hypothetical protein Taro_054448 [Colocasia esculenta]|uniref:Uncharacterized protein n=1 Tax=Colocasia esculenta TaxID=4460 RepID=A0A843XNI8_COLES|nr:hypothetical protein [Colocasia esculenta]